MALVNRPSKRLPGVYRLWHTNFTVGVSDVYDLTAATQQGTDYELCVFSYQQLGATNGTRGTNIAGLRSGAAAAGHDVAVLVYLNGSYLAKGSRPDGTNLPLSAYARAAGDPTKFLVDDGKTWLGNFGEESYRGDPGPAFARGLWEEAIQRRDTVFTGTGADGHFCDSLGWGIISDNYNTRTADGDPNATSPVQVPSTAIHDKPLNPRTGVAFTEAEWLVECLDLACSVRGKVGNTTPLPSAWVVNGFSQGSRYFDAVAPISLLTRGAQGCVMESWLRSATDSVGTFQSENEWIQDVNAVIDIQHRGKYALPWTKVWDGTHAHVVGSSDDDGNLASIVKIHRQFVASFMLATDGTSFAHFRHDPNPANERIPKDRWYGHLNALGNPVENWNTPVSSDGLTGGIMGTGAKRATSDGSVSTSTTAGAYYFRRLFANGVVLYNPRTTAATSAKVTGLTPNATYTDLDGTTYVADSSGVVTITIAGNTGYALHA